MYYVGIQYPKYVVPFYYRKINKGICNIYRECNEFYLADSLYKEPEGYNEITKPNDDELIDILFKGMDHNFIYDKLAYLISKMAKDYGMSGKEMFNVVYRGINLSYNFNQKVIKGISNENRHLIEIADKFSEEIGVSIPYLRNILFALKKTPEIGHKLIAERKLKIRALIRFTYRFNVNELTEILYAIEKKNMKRIPTQKIIEKINEISKDNVISFINELAEKPAKKKSKKRN